MIAEAVLLDALEGVHSGRLRVHEAYRTIRAAEQDSMKVLTAPSDPDARMEAYYYGFERTGFALIDDVLSAVATAGKHFHGTDQWATPDFDPNGLTEEASIQAAANRAGALLSAVTERREATT